MGYAVTMFTVAISGFIPLLPMMALLHWILWKKDSMRHLKTVKSHIAAVYLFCFAVVAVLAITSIPGVYHFSIDMAVNIIPFVDIRTNSLDYALNILLFIPLGFLLPMLWKQFEKKHFTFLCGFFFSLSIEFMQLFNNRVTDIDDLLMNTAGTIIGYFLFMGIKKGFPKISVFALDRTNCWKWEPHFCFFFAWLSMLVFKPLVSSWLLGPTIIK